MGNKMKHGAVEGVEPFRCNAFGGQGVGIRHDAGYLSPCGAVYLLCARVVMAGGYTFKEFRQRHAFLFAFVTLQYVAYLQGRKAMQFTVGLQPQKPVLYFGAPAVEVVRHLSALRPA